MRPIGWILAGLLLATPVLATAQGADQAHRRFGQWSVWAPFQGYCRASVTSTEGGQEIWFYFALAADAPSGITARQMTDGQQFLMGGPPQSLEYRAGGQVTALRVTEAGSGTFVAVFETPFQPETLARPGAHEVWWRDVLLFRISRVGVAAASRAIAACKAGRNLP